MYRHSDGGSESGGGHWQQLLALPTVSGIANSWWYCQQLVVLPTVGGIANACWQVRCFEQVYVAPLVPVANTS
jgi:hypothetical protein